MNIIIINYALTRTYTNNQKATKAYRHNLLHLENIEAVSFSQIRESRLQSSNFLHLQSDCVSWLFLTAVEGR